MISHSFKVSGLDTSNEALNLKNSLISIEGVSNVAVDTKTSEIKVTFDPKTADIYQIKQSITDSGISIEDSPI